MWPRAIDYSEGRLLAAAAADLPADSTGNDCSSCVFRHSGNRAVRFIADSRDRVAEPAGIYERERPFASPIPQSATLHPRHAPLKAGPDNRDYIVN